MIDLLSNGKNDPRLDIRLSGIQKKLQEMIKSMEEKTFTEEVFISWMVNVSKWIGYRINRYNVTMYEFAVITKKMIEEAEISKKHTEKLAKNARLHQ
jgi:hypothetical protein